MNAVATDGRRVDCRRSSASNHLLAEKAGASTEGEVDATCVQFGSRGERIPPSRGENFPR